MLAYSVRATSDEEESIRDIDTWMERQEACEAGDWMRVASLDTESLGLKRRPLNKRDPDQTRTLGATCDQGSFTEGEG